MFFRSKDFVHLFFTKSQYLESVDRTSRQLDSKTRHCRLQTKVIAKPRNPTPRLRSVWFRAEILGL